MLLKKFVYSLGIKRTLTTSTPRLDHGIKTSKERREHFLNVNSWKAHDLNETRHVDHFEEKRQPKKKAALMLGYNGSAYQGMQANPGTHSIEAVLFDALCKVGAVSKSNSIDPKKVQLMRAARTDKGVHASCNLVSLKMICCDDDLVEKLNSVLPNHIRIWGYVEAQRNFHAKTKCDSRIYEYLLPSYTLKPFLEPKVLKEIPTSNRDYKIMTNNGTTTRYITPTDPYTLSHFRVEKDQFETFRQAMMLFQGTHNFHNYTITRSFKDPAANRFILNISVDNPVLIQGMEWISIKLHGQSFMLHQIRKMISMAMYTTRLGSPLSLIPKTFEKHKMNIPKAPALGLLLDRPVFQLYNDRIKSIENRQPIDFDVYKETIEVFKQDFIYTKIVEQEQAENIYDQFLVTIDAHLDSTYKYFNANGEIPSDCILKTKYSVE